MEPNQYEARANQLTPDEIRECFATWPLGHLQASYYMYAGRLAESDDREALIEELVGLAVSLRKQPKT